MRYLLLFFERLKIAQRRNEALLAYPIGPHRLGALPPVPKSSLLRIIGSVTTRKHKKVGKIF